MNNILREMAQERYKDLVDKEGCDWNKDEVISNFIDCYKNIEGFELSKLVSEMLICLLLPPDRVNSANIEAFHKRLNSFIEELIMGNVTDDKVNIILKNLVIKQMPSNFNIHRKNSLVKFINNYSKVKW